MTNFDLKSIVKNYPNCLKNPSLLRSILQDLYPESSNKLNINITVTILQGGYLKGIENRTSVTVDELSKLCLRLEQDYGISPQRSQDIFIEWFKVWNIALPNAVPNTALNTEPQTRTQVPAVSAPVSAQAGGFELERTERGWVVVDYDGMSDDFQTLVIPSQINGKKIVGIGEYAFATFLEEELVISEGIVFIEAEAFRFNDNLRTVTLPESLQEIGDYAFANCKKLSRVEWPSQIQGFNPSRNLFDGCPKMKYQQFPHDGMWFTIL